MSTSWAVIVRRKAVWKAGMLALLCAAVGISAEPPAAARAPQGPQVFEMTAKKYDFTPTPHIKVGQKFELKVTATDHDHGVSIEATPDGAANSATAGLTFDSPEKCWKVKKGETITIDGTATTPGTYTIKCCVDCGMGHRHMRGQIVVEQ